MNRYIDIRDGVVSNDDVHKAMKPFNLAAAVEGMHYRKGHDSILFEHGVSVVTYEIPLLQTFSGQQRGSRRFNVKICENSVS